MKILLTGKNGQVGFELQRALAPIGEIVAVDQDECDLSNEQGIRDLVRRIKPNVIINPAAYTAVDKAETERDLAFAVNAKAPEILGEEAARLNAFVVHYSTDYIFDGEKKGFYVETDEPNPQNVYGASKLVGEQALQAANDHHMIFRTSWVVGAHGHNFTKTILRLAAERDSLNIVGDQFGVPTSAALIADVTALILNGMRDNLLDSKSRGVYNLTASGVTTWYDYAIHVIQAARTANWPVKVTPDSIREIPTTDYPTPAKRPLNSRLDTTKLHQAFGLFLPDWRIGVDHILQQILQD